MVYRDVWTRGRVGMAAAAKRGRSTRRPRGSLTRDLIARESLRLLDEGGQEAFSMPRLGRALDSDQTAVYRHFASKDDLVLAVAELLQEEVMEGYEPGECWRDSLLDLGHRIFRVYVSHPAAGSISSPRTTRGPHEMKLADALLEAVLRAGFTGEPAVLHYRIFVDLALAWSGAHASVLSLEPAARQGDEESWKREYVAVDPAQYPHIARVRGDLAVKFETIFDRGLAMMLDQINAAAPNPCTCDAPAKGAGNRRRPAAKVSARS
jgi:AcrR family transcriptional regulator